jgi:hypothetical protein
VIIRLFKTQLGQSNIQKDSEGEDCLLLLNEAIVHRGKVEGISLWDCCLVFFEENEDIK